MAEYIFDEWIKKVEKLQSSIGKELAEIRQAKADLQEFKTELYNDLAVGQFIRDDKRIVISAPEIIIGNVDKTGELLQLGGSSRVVLRSNEVGLNGVSNFEGTIPGTVNIKAPIINQEAIDTGLDGVEQEVGDISGIYSKARNIVLASSTGTSIFNAPTDKVCHSGVEIHSDAHILLDASSSMERESAHVQKNIEALKEIASALKSDVADLKIKTKEMAKYLMELMDKNEKANGAAEDDTRVNISDLKELNEDYHVVSKLFYDVMSEYMTGVSTLVETSRQQKAYEERKKEIDKKKGKFKEELTGAAITVRGEVLNVVSADGDGNVRQNPGAGVAIRSKNVVIAGLNYDGALIDKSQVSIASENVNISTANPKRSDPKKADNSDNPAVGNVVVTSKNILLESVDYEVKDKKLEEKALTTGGKINVRAENINLAAFDKEGKATGKLGLNAKDIAIRSTDVKREKGKPSTDDKLAAGGSLLVSAEKVIVGSKSKDNKTKTMQIAGENVGLFADTTAEMQQGEGKAVVTLDGGNVALGGSKNEIAGDTEIKGKTDVKGDMTAPKATIENVEAKSSFKSTNISDGVAVPAPASPGKPSAKLKAEEVKDAK